MILKQVKGNIMVKISIRKNLIRNIVKNQFNENFIS
jgi:hypothetical protein